MPLVRPLANVGPAVVVAPIVEELPHNWPPELLKGFDVLFGPVSCCEKMDMNWPEIERADVIIYRGIFSNIHDNKVESFVSEYKQIQSSNGIFFEECNESIFNIPVVDCFFNSMQTNKY